jgi:hypothetical protein
MGWFWGQRRTIGDRCFGIYDKVACCRCGGDAHISRRTPHPDRGSGFELQTFTCRLCEHEQTRVADHAGDVLRAG